MALYVRVSVSFFAHRKTARLHFKLGNDAYWLLPRLWAYAAEHQPDGDFSKYTAEEIAMLLDYKGDASSMLQALQDAGWLDEMRIHDWEQHNAYHSTFSERAKKAAEARWGKEKKQKKRVQRNRNRASIAEHCSSNAQAMLEAFPSEFQSEWRFFVEHRNKKGAKMTDHAQELLLTKLQKRPADAVSALQMAITRNWTGFEWDWYDKQAANGTGFSKPKQVDPNQQRLDREYEEARKKYG